MAQKRVKTRIINKHDTEENWNKAVNFIPLKGEIIEYDPDSSHSNTRIKIGDGVTKVAQLPFYLEERIDSKIDKTAFLDAGIKSAEWETILPQTTVTTAEDIYKSQRPTGTKVRYWGYFNSCPYFKYKQTLRVTYNDVVYDNLTCSYGIIINNGTAGKHPSSTDTSVGGSWQLLGNRSLYDSRYTNTGEPFCILYLEHGGMNTDGEYYYGYEVGKGVLFTASAVSVTIKIERAAIVQTALPKSLSDNYGMGDPIFEEVANSGYVKTSLGSGNVVGKGAFASGNSNIASGNISRAQGYQNVASGIMSSAEGAENTASATWAHAQGYQNVASGPASSAEGRGVVASGTASRAEGYKTTASGNYSHAQGQSTTASGVISHAGGNHSEASQRASFAHGNFVHSNQPAQFAVGYGNDSKEDSIFEVGNGLNADGQPNNTGNVEPATRQNAFRVTKAGVAVAQTGIQIGNTSIDENKLKTLADIPGYVKIGTAADASALLNIEYIASADISNVPDKTKEYAITDLISYGDLDSNLQEQIDHMGNTGPTGPKGEKGDVGPTGPTGATGVSGSSFAPVAVTRSGQPESVWTNWGYVDGSVKTWSGTDASKIKVGDTFLVCGTATDTKNVHKLYYKNVAESGSFRGSCYFHDISYRGAVGPTGADGTTSPRIPKSLGPVSQRHGADIPCTIFRNDALGTMRSCALIQEDNGYVYLMTLEMVMGSSSVILTSFNGGSVTVNNLTCLTTDGVVENYINNGSSHNFSSIDHITFPNACRVLLYWEDNNLGTCFIEGSDVCMADGTYKKIENVSLNDSIVFVDQETKQTGNTKVVLPPVVGTCNEYKQYVFSDGKQLNVYGDQRIWREEDSEYRYLSEFKIGEHTRDVNGNVIELVEVNYVAPNQPVKHIYLITDNCKYNVSGIMTAISEETKYNNLLLAKNKQYRPDEEQMHKIAKRALRKKFNRAPWENPLGARQINNEKDGITVKTIEINSLKKYLNDTDYIVMKHAEGVLSDEEFEYKKGKRQEARDQINNLESLVLQHENKIEEIKNYWKIRSTRETYASFVENTKILLDSGEIKNIQDIKNGDVVRYVGDGGENRSSVVVLPAVPEIVLEYWHIVFTDGSSLCVSGNRQGIFNFILKKYINSADIKPGDKIGTSNGEPLMVRSIEKKYYDTPKVFWRLVTLSGNYLVNSIMTYSWRGRGYKEVTLPENKEYLLDEKTMEDWRKSVEG